IATALLTRSLTRLALGPLDRLRDTAAELAETADLSVRVPAGEGPEEVDALAGDMNAMLERLETTADGREAALASARRFAADAGHELRTPLTSLHANLATGATDAAERDAERLTALVDQLQQLARGEAGPPAHTEDVDLGELADSAVLTARQRHPELTATLDAPDRGPTLRGEAASLRMLLDNLLENAARHGRPGGTVAVTVTPLDGRGAELLVDDDGPGIPADERERVLERFARGTGARGSGTGLGLSIAAAQAARHAGHLTLEDAPLGGLRVRVVLPGLPQPVA
ncbi:MAG: HAMP domain-containing histidine kinase, partial [Dehalococcoidia bacterium]|nr:HAMP domain-containing histidine kinase [Dehalococcoidia bacterium]